MRAPLLATASLLSLFLAACGGEEEAIGDVDDTTNSADDDDASDDDASDDDGASDDDAPDDDDDDGPAIPALNLIAGGDDDAFTLTELYAAPSNLFCEDLARDCPGLGVDLDFNPARPGELWVVFRQPYGGEPCDTPSGNTAGPDQSGCPLLRSKVAVITGADTDAPSVELKEDGNSWHFMRLATSLAFADDDTFATLGEARTGNYMDQSIDFMGPTWWSSDPEIFAQDFMLNGSHLDMLHATPFGMGIAHQRDHVFWCFNGQLGSVDRYDFRDPHVPGGEDHSDGEYRRYAEGQLAREPNVPSHMAFAEDGTTLFIADSGNRRVVEFDTTRQGETRGIVVDDPQIAEPLAVDGVDVEEVVPSGVVTLPSGLAVFGEHLIVSDAQNSLIHVFDIEGSELGSLDTGLEPGSLAGITVGPDDRLYLVDWPNARVLRLDVD